jgi:hypothetical protein
MSLTVAGRGARVLAVDAPMFQVVKLLLDKGADVNASTLLHQSLDRGPAFVRMLLEHGARLDLKDSSGRTALDIANGVPAAAPPPGGAGARGARGGPGGPGGAALAAAGPIDPATVALLKEFGARSNKE